MNALFVIVKRKKKLVSRQSIRKLVKFNNRYFWDMHQPGWPSKSFDENFKWMISKVVLKNEIKTESVRLVFMAITKKCIMKCEHCFEWDEINKKEVLELNTLKAIVAKYQKLGASIFILTGGEPMTRFDDLIELLKYAEYTSDFWITTSGYNLTEEKALQLKQAGLTGVSISIDDYRTEENNAFRGHPKAMEYATAAIESCRKAGLGIGTAICTTKQFISKENLLKYAEFTKKLGVGFIWLIEPRAVGKYAGKDVRLTKQDFDLLDEFYHSMNKDKAFRDFPRVIFPNYNHRNVGCAGAGKGNVMIDTDGFINPCPVCRKKIAFALAENSEENVRKMQAEGCFKFKSRVS